MGGEDEDREGAVEKEEVEMGKGESEKAVGEDAALRESIICLRSSLGKRRRAF